MQFNMFTAAVATNQLMPGQTSYERRLEPHEQEICKRAPHVLESYHYVEKERFVREMRNAGAKVFLDSGAFSAFSIGAEIDLPAYCNYIHRNKDIIRHDDGIMLASVLDGIGDPLQTYRNQLAMEQLGVRPLPCFHYGEDERYLEWYIQHYPYITIGGMVGKPAKQLEIWLDRIWSRYLLDASGNPRLKVHAFGITSIPIMKRYPWYSVDSSSWVQSAAFGVIMDSVYGNIQISSQSPSRHDMGRHLTTLTPIEREAVEARIVSKGFNSERLSQVPFSRFAYNISTYEDINADINQNKILHPQAVPHVQELF